MGAVGNIKYFMVNGIIDTYSIVKHIPFKYYNLLIIKYDVSFTTK